MAWPFFKRAKPAASRTRRFDAAGGRWSQGASHLGNVGAETLAAGPVIRPRARHAFANNPHAAAGVEAMTTGLVGAGITPASRHPDPAARETIGEFFMRWTEQADADGITDWFGLQAQIAQALVVDGEAFVRLEYTPRGLKLRQIPAEMVDESLTRELGGGARIVGGIEFSASGERIAYWVRPFVPTDIFATAREPVRIPADEMVHIFRPMGAGQVRGISWLAPVLLKLGELDQLSDALTVGAKVSSMHAGFLIDLNNMSGELPFDGDQAGSILESGLEPGTLKVLPAGTDIRFNSPQAAVQTVEFLSAELRAVASGLGVPVHLLTGDVTQANYSSLRAAMVAFRQRLERWQNHILIPQLCRPIWEKAITYGVMSGAIDAPDFERNPADWLRAEFFPPRQPWVDPLKDAQAVREMLDSKLMSRRQAIAELGWNIEAIDAEIAADRARETALGIATPQESTDD